MQNSELSHVNCLLMTQQKQNNWVKSYQNDVIFQREQSITPFFEKYKFHYNIAQDYFKHRLF